MCMCLFVNITMFDLYSVICFSCFYWENPSKTHKENPFYCLRVRNRSFVGLRMRICYQNKYFEARKCQTLKGFFSQLCTCFAWGATDSDKVSFLSIDSCEIYVIPGVQRNCIFSVLILRPIKVPMNSKITTHFFQRKRNIGI